jgi:hypothetical protein
MVLALGAANVLLISGVGIEVVLAYARVKAPQMISQIGRNMEGRI